MKTSAGIMFVYRKRALLFHATNARDRTYMPPKGMIEEGETPEEAASRETLEEAGIFYPASKLKDSFTVDYTDNSGKVYKKAQIFVVKIENLSEIGLEIETVNPSRMQLEEVDEGHFMGIEEIRNRALPRYVDHILKHLQ
jgi:8-oxo-dGTP pyrophosphatase MutT (NUDIX family)